MDQDSPCQTDFLCQTVFLCLIIFLCLIETVSLPDSQVTLIVAEIHLKQSEKGVNVLIRQCV